MKNLKFVMIISFFVMKIVTEFLTLYAVNLNDGLIFCI